MLCEMQSVQDLNSCRRVQFLQRLPLHHGHLLFRSHISSVDLYMSISHVLMIITHSRPIHEIGDNESKSKLEAVVVRRVSAFKLKHLEGNFVPWQIPWDNYSFSFLPFLEFLEDKKIRIKLFSSQRKQQSEI